MSKPKFREQIERLSHVAADDVVHFRVGAGTSVAGSRVMLGLDDEPLRSMPVDVAIMLVAKIMEAVETIETFEKKRGAPPSGPSKARGFPN